MQFQRRRRVEVANNKIRRLTMLIVESNEWSNLESTEGIAERQRERRALLIQLDRKSTRLNSSHPVSSRMPSSA